MSTPLPLLKSLQASVKRAADQQAGPAMHTGLQEALNAARAVDPEQREEFRRLVAQSVPLVDSVTGAGQLSIWLGSSVEAGCPAAATVEPLIDAFLRWSATLVTVEDGEDPPAEKDCVIGLQMIGQSLVAHLAQEDGLRHSAVANRELNAELERIEHLTPGAWWLRGLLTQQSGIVSVVHLEKSIGFRVSYTNVCNCFHLLTLLQGRLEGMLPGTRPVDPQIFAVANGESWEEVTDEAWWDYFVADGLGGLSLLDGLQSPADLSVVGNSQVLFLRAPSAGGLSWDGGFFAPVLSASPPEVKMERQLTAEEIAAFTSQLTT